MASFGALILVCVGCVVAGWISSLVMNPSRHQAAPRMNYNATKALIHKGEHMHYIETARVRISRCERNVDSQRQRLERLPEDNAARWAAEQLLAASEATLQSNREHLRGLLVR